jgi:hypothetical protein
MVASSLVSAYHHLTGGTTYQMLLWLGRSELPLAIQNCAKSGRDGATVAGPTDRVSTAILLSQIRLLARAACRAGS